MIKDAKMKLITIVLGASLITMPLLAQASDLIIANASKFTLSFQINNICSTKFGNIPTDTIKTISAKDFNEECKYNSKICVTNVYSKPNCDGFKVAEIGFDRNYGVSYLSASTSGVIDVHGNGFNLFFISPT